MGKVFLTVEELLRDARPTDALKLSEKEEKELAEFFWQSDLRRAQDWSILANQVVGAEVGSD